MAERCLLLALGNDILKDDGVGLAAASLLRSEFKEAVDIVEAPGTGLALLELLAGYDRALLLEAIFTGSAPPGTVLEFCREDFQKAAAPSAHYVGLPEVLRRGGPGVRIPELRIRVETPSVQPDRPGDRAPARYVDQARQVLKPDTLS
jgi:hydrogenase maturation protease